MRFSCALRHRHCIAIATSATATLAWLTVIALDMANVDDHIWGCALVIAGIATLGALQWPMIHRLDRAGERFDSAYQAMARHMAARPADAPMTPAAGWPQLYDVRYEGPHIRRGRHVSGQSDRAGSQ